MPRTKTENQKIKDARRRQIALAALKVFSVKSYYGATMTDIAKEAGISHSLIYHYFKDKQEIFDFAEDENSRAVFEKIEQINIKTIGFEQKFRQIAEFFLKAESKDKYSSYRFFAVISKKLADISSSAPQSGPPEIRRLTGKIILSVFEEGARENKLPAGMDAESAASFFWIFLSGVNLGNILKPDKEKKELTEKFIKLFTAKENNT